MPQKGEGAFGRMADHTNHVAWGLDLAVYFLTAIRTVQRSTKRTRDSIIPFACVNFNKNKACRTFSSVFQYSRSIKLNSWLNCQSSRRMHHSTELYWLEKKLSMAKASDGMNNNCQDGMSLGNKLYSPWLQGYPVEQHMLTLSPARAIKRDSFLLNYVKMF